MNAPTPPSPAPASDDPLRDVIEALELRLRVAIEAVTGSTEQPPLAALAEHPPGRRLELSLALRDLRILRHGVEGLLAPRYRFVDPGEAASAEAWAAEQTDGGGRTPVEGRSSATQPRAATEGEPGRVSEARERTEGAPKKHARIAEADSPAGRAAASPSTATVSLEGTVAQCRDLAREHLPEDDALTAELERICHRATVIQQETRQLERDMLAAMSRFHDRLARARQVH